MSDDVVHVRLIVVVSAFSILVIIFFWEILVLSWVRVNFQRITIRISICNARDHGLVC